MRDFKILSFLRLIKPSSYTGQALPHASLFGHMVALERNNLWMILFSPAALKGPKMLTQGEALGVLRYNNLYSWP